MGLTQNIPGISNKISSWAHLNFKLQFIAQQQEEVSTQIHEQLNTIGYVGKCIKELQENEHKKLFEKESFFSSSQTGKRIAAFALKLNGLNQDHFEEIEESITNAYITIKDTYKESPLLEKSYQHTLDTLYIFKL